MKFGDVVAIQGAGGLGIYAAAVAAERGASKVISIDGQRARLDLALQCGATDVIDLNEFQTPAARVQRVKDLTDGRGADIVVEVVGLASATVEGLDMVRLNGKYVDIGNIVPQTVTLPATKVITQQIKWLGHDALRPVDRAGRARHARAHARQVPAGPPGLAQLPAVRDQPRVRARGVAGEEHGLRGDARDLEARRGPIGPAASLHASSRAR